jgi:pimeloyl-ACP methyl ester carboxylesterase
MVPLRHCIRGVLTALILAVPWTASAQQAPPADPSNAEPSNFAVYVRAAMVGTEQIAVSRESDGWSIVSSGRLAPPLDVTNRRLQLRYDSNWKPVELMLEATVRGQVQTIHTTLAGGTATSNINIAGKTGTVTAATAADFFFPSPFFAPLEALGVLLKTAAPGTVLTAFAPVETEITVLVGESVEERLQTPRETVDTRRTRIRITPQIGGVAPFEAELWADANGRLLRYSVPAQALEVVRDDIASVATRRVPISRPNDEQVRIRANGFVLAGTLSKPAQAATPRLPAILLVGGSGQTDRDELVFDIPIFGQLAGAFADGGMIALRYDRRGVGQSGGREEAATLNDYANDVRAAVRFLADRKDVDPDRITLLGHGDGGPVAMIAAAREKRVASLVLVATLGTTGAELNLERVVHTVQRSNRTEADKQATIELQRRIQQAVLTGQGWTDELALYRRQADTPWYQSFLAFDAAKVMKDIRQPILIVQGELDTEVRATHADRLQMLANARKNRPPARVVKVPGINHLLVPAATGEVEEYATLETRQVSPKVTDAVIAWLRTIPPD